MIKKVVSNLSWIILTILCFWFFKIYFNRPKLTNLVNFHFKLICSEYGGADNKFWLNRVVNVSCDSRAGMVTWKLFDIFWSTGSRVRFLGRVSVSFFIIILLSIRHNLTILSIICGKKHKIRTILFLPLPHI